MEQRLPGGNLGGAVRVGDTVRRVAGPWTPGVAALLQHLESVGFTAAPRFLGIDEQGREVLSFIDGETVGDSVPWPAWTHADETPDDSERAAGESANGYTAVCTDSQLLAASRGFSADSLSENSRRLSE